MRDFPVFTTENGVASIVLKEVPYKGIAYITIQDSLAPTELLTECVEFAQMAGARHIYATGHEMLEKYPLYTSVLKMSRSREGIQETDCALFPVTEKTKDQWQNLYNEKMKAVSNSSTMTNADMEKLLTRGGGYFIHKDGELLGIGSAFGDTVESVIAAKPGVGEAVMLALCSSLFSERIVLEVASNNAPALKLYEKLGFIRVSELSRWYDVLTRKNT
ncbi:MAG: GNAT family N-acetyltransferase [Oscillospiraceae bacterium]|nr:GNAT family N-acetyltransferase [Oscillospiraceae bacterium]